MVQVARQRFKRVDVHRRAVWIERDGEKAGDKNKSELGGWGVGWLASSQSSEVFGNCTAEIDADDDQSQCVAAVQIDPQDH